VFAFRSSARALAAGLPRQDHVYKTADESPQQKFKVGLGISQTNADSQWNLVYNVFHRKFIRFFAILKGLISYMGE